MKSWSDTGWAARAAATLIVAGVSMNAAASGRMPAEDYIPEPMPTGVKVLVNELEGPVFADARGKTLYMWPRRSLQNGSTGDQKAKPSTCTDQVYTENSGLMSIYPAGLELPNIAARPSCAQMWPPFLAPTGAQAVGKWTIVERMDGRKQWAYDGWPIYTSVLDRRPGDVLGGTKRFFTPDQRRDMIIMREPIAPRSKVPAELGVFQVATGRLLGTHVGYSVYAYDKDEANKSHCIDTCLDDWQPVEAPDFAQTVGEFSAFERAPGVKQWAFRGRPLYTRAADRKLRSLDGGDEPGWHNVYTQMAPPPPLKDFTVQDTRSGQVYADAQGRTLYIYYCGDDALDQLPCDHPDTEQAYRLAICGGGDVDTCNKAFQYVIAPGNANSGSHIWGTMYIDPRTGHRARRGSRGALHVWTYRDRPIYTFYLDRKPGDLYASPWGEFWGRRNGFKAFWIRDAFRENAE